MSKLRLACVATAMWASSTCAQPLKVQENASEYGEAAQTFQCKLVEQGQNRIVAADLPSTVYAFSRCMIPDVQVAVDCGVQGVVMEIPSSRHLIELGYRWSVERATTRKRVSPPARSPDAWRPSTR